MNNSVNIIKTYEEFQKNTQLKPFDIKYMAIGMGGEVGEVLNEIKKMERDDNNVLTSNRKDKIIEELGDVLWYIVGTCRLIDTDLETVLNKNIEKLFIKKE